MGWEGFPDLTQVRNWAGVTAATVSDADLQAIVDAEHDVQRRTLRLPPETDPPATYPPALVRALLRRVQRHVAARQMPLGMVGDPGMEYGAAYLRSEDPEVRRLENPYRIAVVA